MPTRSSRPPRLDMNQLAKRILDEATGEAEKTQPKTLTGKKADSSKGGLKGGRTRMGTLTPEQRSELAKQAAAARWGKDAPTVSSAGAVVVKKKTG